MFGSIASLLLVPSLVLGGERATLDPAPTPGDTVRAVTWQIDPTHSELTFQIRHLIGRVNGTFGDWGGTVVADPKNLSVGSVDVTIQAASIDTDNEKRDGHLRSGDFFDAERFPTITFESRKVEVKGDKLKVWGNLTMRGVTKPVVLNGAFLGVGPDPWGKQRIAFEAETTINRQDFGVSWNDIVEAGGAVLGDDVKISMVVQAVQQ
jgi:polyisoprenoid-binding protein YceI